MSTREARRRELLKPPEIKPVFTILIMFASILAAMFLPMPAKPEFAFVQNASVTPAAATLAIAKHNPAILVKMILAALGNMSIWVMLVNFLFIWIFGSQIEKRLVTWRYPLFLLLGMIIPYIFLAFDDFAGAQRMYTGPTLLTTFMIGAYLVFKPKKPFKPAEWKPLPWKIFKGDEASGLQLKVKWVDPNVYIGMFVLWTALLQVMFMIPRNELIELTHLDFMGAVHQFFVGTIQPGRVAFISPVSGIGSLAAGALFGYILVNIVANWKVKRAASDLQVQAVLQYKELRALDMNHLQAVEGTARLIGVPLDVAKEWIAKGMQPTKDKNE